MNLESTALESRLECGGGGRRSGAASAVKHADVAADPTARLTTVWSHCPPSALDTATHSCNMQAKVPHRTPTPLASSDFSPIRLDTRGLSTQVTTVSIHQAVSWCFSHRSCWKWVVHWEQFFRGSTFGAIALLRGEEERVLNLSTTPPRFTLQTARIIDPTSRQGSGPTALHPVGLQVS